MSIYQGIGSFLTNFTFYFLLWAFNVRGQRAWIPLLSSFRRGNPSFPHMLTNTISIDPIKGALRFGQPREGKKMIQWLPEVHVYNPNSFCKAGSGKITLIIILLDLIWSHNELLLYSDDECNVVLTVLWNQGKILRRIHILFGKTFLHTWDHKQQVHIK